MKTIKSSAAWVALAHFFLFLLTVLYVSKSHDPQAALIWGIWAVADFPVSLLYFVAGKTYSGVLNSVSDSQGVLAWFLYMPHWIHGLFGTLWWYLLARSFISFRKREES